MSYLMELLFQINHCKACSYAMGQRIEQIKLSKDLNSIQFINLDLLIQLQLKRLSNSFISLNLPQFKPLREIVQFRNLVRL